ncbi:hypothetical protein JNL27_11780 [bacterium]|nr:hypothetical protein [bacterium]
MITTPFLSKSKYLNGLQCPKPDAETQAIFDQEYDEDAGDIGSEDH